MKPSKSHQQKEAIDAARDAIMPIVNAMSEDNRREEEQLYLVITENNIH